jgi:hypothetical protein
MRVAIYFSGRIKGFLKVKEKLKKIQEKHNAIFFCSLNEEFITPETGEFCDLYNLDYNQINIQKTSEIIPSEIFTLSKRPETSYENAFSMFYHNKKCMELIKNYENINSFKFDIIVKYRADLDNYMDLDIFSIYKNDKIIYIPEDPPWYIHVGLNDQIAIGGNEIMEIYSNAVDSIVNLCKNYNTLYNPEIILNDFLWLNNLTIELFSYQYEIVKK